jgi:hypothetical protein
VRLEDLSEESDVESEENSDTGESVVFECSKPLKTAVASTCASDLSEEERMNECESMTVHGGEDHDANKNESVCEDLNVALSKRGKPWAKKHFCWYCSGEYSKMARHLEQKHSNEIDVQIALSFPKKSQDRKTKWMLL